MSQAILAISADEQQSTFHFGEHVIRIIMRDGEPWFVATDVCKAMSIQWKGAGRTGTLAALDDNEKGVALTDTLGGQQQVAIISESGLNVLVLRCRDAIKPGTISYRFRKWVTGEVLPSIRKTGGYGKRDHQFVQDAILASSRIAAEAQQHIFAALMNDEDWRNHRWIMNFIPDRRDGKLFANIMQIASDDMCVSMKNLAARILDVAGSHPTDQQLNDIAIACNQRLSWRIQHREKQEAAKKSQAGGALAVA